MIIQVCKLKAEEGKDANDSSILPAAIQWRACAEGEGR